MIENAPSLAATTATLLIHERPSATTLADVPGSQAGQQHVARRIVEHRRRIAKHEAAQPSVSPLAPQAGVTKNPEERALSPPAATLRLPLERDKFLSSVIGDVAGALQDAVGLEAASELIGAVGRRIGREISDGYKAALGIPVLPQARVAEVLVDLNRRIQGDFRISGQDEDKIVLVNWVCPFGRKVSGRPAMCMMTSNMFGTIAAENLDYARVVLEKTIAGGASGCRVAVYLKPLPEGEAMQGREYFKRAAPEADGATAPENGQLAVVRQAPDSRSEEVVPLARQGSMIP